MEFRDGPGQAVWRSEVRDFIRSNCPEEIRTGGWAETADPSTKGAFDRWRDALAGRGWVAAGWPKEYGGAGLSPIEQFIFNQEVAEAGAPQVGGIGVMFLGPTLIVHGSEQQKRKHIPAILSGETVWCQGYSEPGSGSDLASLQTRATRDGDDWVISGQKIWTSSAHIADWCFCLARTDPSAPKHRGISYFLVDMRTPGISVRPLINMGGVHGFNEVFFDNVRVPAENVVGEVNRGWYIATTTLDFERSSIGSTVSHRQTVERNIAWFRTHKGDLHASAYEPIRHKWIDRLVETQVLTLLSQRIISMQTAGMVPNSEASIAKLFNSELGQRISQTAMEMLGMWGGIISDDAPLAGQVPRSYVQNVSATIGGGTSEIQRNVIATRGLGLPRG